MSHQSCVFNCGHCQPGAAHYCKSCGSWNAHRSINCPKNKSITNSRCYVCRTTPMKHACGVPSCSNHYCLTHKCVHCGKHQKYSAQPHVSSDCPSLKRAARVYAIQPSSRTVHSQVPTHGSARTSQGPRHALTVPSRSTGVGVYLVHGTSILCGKRASWLTHGKGTIGTPGGSIDAGESAHTAATRELYEETTITGIPLVFSCMIGTHAIFVARVSSKPRAKANNEWDGPLRWISFDARAQQLQLNGTAFEGCRVFPPTFKAIRHVASRIAKGTL